jgi:hypothetical protein
MVDMQTILTHNKECPVRPVGRGLVIVSPEGNETHSIEDIGAFIWNRIDGSKPLGEILDDILNEYRVAQTTAEKDLQDFITQLVEAKLVLPV